MELKQMSWATFVRWLRCAPALTPSLALVLTLALALALGKLCSCATSKNWTSNTQFMSMCAPSAGPHGKCAVINKNK